MSREELAEHYSFYHDDELDCGNIPLTYEAWLAEYKEPLLLIMEEDE